MPTSPPLAADSGRHEYTYDPDNATGGHWDHVQITLDGKQAVPLWDSGRGPTTGYEAGPCLLPTAHRMPPSLTSGSVAVALSTWRQGVELSSQVRDLPTAVA
jgi:hypothetical protein